MKSFGSVVLVNQNCILSFYFKFKSLYILRDMDIRECWTYVSVVQRKLTRTIILLDYVANFFFFFFLIPPI